MFPSVPPTSDEYELRNQRISTILFIILLIVILTILLFYTSLVTITENITVKTPTIHQYLQLYAKYPHTLTCACTKISIKYESIVNVKYSIHQICTTDFVSDDWIKYLSSAYTGADINFDDFRWTATYAFQALRAFCELTNRTILDELNGFYSGEYVSGFVTPSKLFRSQVQASVDQFKISAINSFLLSLFLIRHTTYTNALLSAVQINYSLHLLYGTRFIFSKARLYGDCTCTSQSTCIYESTLRGYLNSQINFTVPGFYVGCYVTESLLQSTLECFYNQTCINILQSYYRSPAQINVTALNPSLSSQYFVNSTIQDLINNLMVEQWTLSEKYDSYYNACQPSQCIYSYTAKTDIIYIVTTLIGLIGGLMTALKLVVPRLVKFFVYRILKRRNVISQIPNVQT